MALQEVLIELIEKNQNNIVFYREQLRTLPKGNLHKSKIDGNNQYYLQYYNDQGDKIQRSINKEELESIINQLETRNQIEKWLQELKEDIKAAEETLQYILREGEQQ